MDSNILSGLMGIAGTLAGTVLGWLLNSLSLRPKLCCVLNESQSKDELTPKELRNKYSNSGYVIEIFNIGLTPVVIASFGIYYKKCTIADGLDINRTIKPYEKVLYELDEQTFDSIEYHRKKSNIKKYDVIIDDVAGKQIKTKMDVEWLKLKVLDTTLEQA